MYRLHPLPHALWSPQNGSIGGGRPATRVPQDIRKLATPDEAVPIPAPLTLTAIRKQARRARRLSRYEEVMHLHEQGASQAHHCGSRWIAS